ncbi:MAG TPA: hypothetical protein VHX88_08910 [Solirubrobacteraceae bacterium]|jgi:hypothetical protein|nr:hypothetical protein [Solirubrobacteraceae bacterium]
MSSLHSIPAFSFDGESFDYGDVIRAATAWGEWASLERALAEPPGEAEVDLRSAIIAFRRARGLLSADDYRRWLETRSLSTDDVDAHLLGRPREIETEAVLSGALHGWAERLIRCLASARSLGREPAAGAGPERIDAVLAAEGALRERVATPERIERCLGTHRLDWQRLRWRQLDFPSEGAAREAALLVREEGLALEDVAGIAHGELQAREAYCEEVPALAGILMSAAPGDLLGPLAGEETWRVIVLVDRRAPSLEDEWLRARAEEELIADALERHLAGRVIWHVEL